MDPMILKLQIKFAKILLNIGAVKLNLNNPFTWSSGMKSPIYCDNRIILSHVPERTELKLLMIDRIKWEQRSEIDAIGGVATGAISMAGIVADAMNLPTFYVRPEPKGHGLKNQIEGDLKPKSKLVLIEDLISTGASSFNAFKALKDAGHEVLFVLASFTYGFNKSEDYFKLWNVPVYTLTNFNVLCDVAEKIGYLQKDEIQIVKSFAKDPVNWYEKHYKK